VKEGGQDTDWKELCYLWSSDFRTHITETRWRKFCAELSAAEAKWETKPATLTSVPDGNPITDRFIDVDTPSLRVRFDRKRGLSLQSLCFFPDFTPAVESLPHGYFDDIAMQTDWYSGDCVWQAPGETAVTDRDWADTKMVREPNGDVRLFGTIPTPAGRIEKSMLLHAHKPRIDFDFAFHWPSWGIGSLRVGSVTLLPDAFSWKDLAIVTHNGGFEPECFDLHGQHVDHGAPVSFLVSASCGLGLTEGWAELTDRQRTIRLEVERSIAPLLGLLTHYRIGNSLFCRLALSALESDETRKPSIYRSNSAATIPRRFRFSLTGRVSQ
jgi:hypothetical protein